MTKPTVDSEGYYPFGFPMPDHIPEDWPVGLFRMDISKYTGKEMTDINLDTVELKKAEFTANVGDKQITAKVADKAEADKADVEKDVPFTA